MRILLIRTSALGDVVHALPVVAALRRHLPEAEIAWVVERPFLPLLEHQGLERLIPVDLRRWRREPLARHTRGDLFAAVRAMRQFRADLAIDLMGNHKAGVLAALSGARRTLGARRVDRREPSSAVWIRRTTPLSGLHAVDRNLSLLGALDIPPSVADFSPARLFPQALAANTPTAGVLIHPGAGWENKRLPIELWAWLVVRILNKDFPVTIATGPSEGVLARGIVEAIEPGRQHARLRIVDPAGLETFAGLARSSQLVIGGDTGPLHLAHALGAPVLMLHGPTDPLRHGPYGAPQRALALSIPCAACYRRYDEPKACLTSIPRPQLWQRVEEALAGTVC